MAKKIYKFEKIGVKTKLPTTPFKTFRATNDKPNKRTLMIQLSK